MCKKRWGRDGASGSIMGILVEIDSNLYGYQAVVTTVKKKYYVNSPDIISGKKEQETKGKADEFKNNVNDIINRMANKA